MALNPVLFFSILALLACCNGPQISSSAPEAQRSAGAEGNTVPELADSILVVFEDSRHNFWFGSNGQGVYRYDGKTLLHFTTRDGLCGNSVRAIQEDRSGAVYIAAGGRISKFDPKAGGQTFTTLSIGKSHPPGSGWDLQPGDLWFAGDQDSGVVYRYDGNVLHRLQFPAVKAAEEFIATHPRSEFPNMRFSPYDVYGIFKDSKGNMWFGTINLGACRYDGKSFTWIADSELWFGDLAFGVRSILEDKDGKFWFSNTRYRYTIYAGDSTGREKGIDPPNGYKETDYAFFMSGVKDNAGDSWMVTFGNGVWRWDGKRMTHYPVKKGTTTVTLFSICRDQSGGLWLGTHTDGAYKFNGKAFEKFSPGAEK